MLASRRASDWPLPLPAVIAILTSKAVSADRLLITAKARKPLGDAAAPTWSSASAGAGVAAGTTGVAVGRGVVTGDLVGCTAVGAAACWHAESTRAVRIASPAPPTPTLPRKGGGGFRSSTPTLPPKGGRKFRSVRC